MGRDLYSSFNWLTSYFSQDIDKKDNTHRYYNQQQILVPTVKQDSFKTYRLMCGGAGFNALGKPYIQG